MKPNRLLAIVGSTIIAITAGGLAAGALSDSGPKSPTPAIIAEVSGVTGETGVDASTTSVPDSTSTTIDDNGSDGESNGGSNGESNGDGQDVGQDVGDNGSDGEFNDESNDDSQEVDDNDSAEHVSGATGSHSDDESSDSGSHGSDD